MGVSKGIESFTSLLLSDLKVNGSLVAEMFNILGFSHPPSEEHQNKMGENNMGTTNQNNMAGENNNMGATNQNKMGENNPPSADHQNKMGAMYENNKMGATNQNNMRGVNNGWVEDEDLSKQILPEKTATSGDTPGKQLCDNSDLKSCQTLEADGSEELFNVRRELDGNGNKVIERQGEDLRKTLEDDLGGECGPRTSSEALHFTSKSEIQVGF